MYLKKSLLLSLYVFAAYPQNCFVVLFSHGIADTYRQAFWYAKSYTYQGTSYTNKRYLFSLPFVSFNYPDATTGPLRVRYQETSFGQSNEIGRLHSVYKSTKKWARKKWNDCNIILFGLSRGASNVGIFAGEYNLKNVKAIILESPYYNMGEVISYLLEQSRLSWVPLSYGQSIAEFLFKRYNRDGASPENMVEHISHDIPVIIICSKKDFLVPYTSSVNVYKKLVQTGHEKVHILILDEGAHAKILSGLDGQKYQAVINAFLRKYNLPYDASIADIGQELFQKCQPSFKEN